VMGGADRLLLARELHRLIRYELQPIDCANVSF
jgi:hypothetical protein